MNHPIAQIVVLACHGNAFLSGRNIAQFFPKNSTCAFCDRVVFVVLEKSFFRKTKEKEIAGTPDEWFALIKKQCAQKIRLVYSAGNDTGFSDRISAGLIGGGGTWAMEVVFPGKHSEHWVARWEVWNRNAPESKIWRVTYGRGSAGTTHDRAPYVLADITAQLTGALQDILAFSEKHQCGGFTKCFAEALDTLESGGKRLYGYHKDLAPEGFLSAEAIALLHAGQRAWVFGGMGSWNDLWFKDDQKEYERVSENLFRIVNEAITAAVNP